MKIDIFKISNILRVAVFASVLLIVSSCGDDDSEPEPVSPIVGTWDLELITTSNFPVGFELSEQVVGALVLGRDFGPETWRFDQEGTYFIEIENPGVNLTEEGTYVYEGSSLELSPDEFSGQLTDYTVTDITESNLTLSFEITGSLWPNEFIETIVQLPADTVIADSVFTANLVDNVQVTRNLVFEKQDE